MRFSPANFPLKFLSYQIIKPIIFPSQLSCEKFNHSAQPFSQANFPVKFNYSDQKTFSPANFLVKFNYSAQHFPQPTFLSNSIIQPNIFPANFPASVKFFIELSCSSLSFTLSQMSSFPSNRFSSIIRLVHYLSSY